MKRIKRGQIGIGHNHGAAKAADLRRLPELFEFVGLVIPEHDREYFFRRELEEYKDIPQMTEEERDAAVIDTEALFRDKPTLTLPPFFLRLVKNGCEIYQKKIGTHYETGSILRLYDEKGFFALGEVQEFSDGSAVKMIKLLREEH